MELDAVEAADPVLRGRDLGVRGVTRDDEPGRHALELIAVAHPHLAAVLDAGKEAGALQDAEVGESVFALLRGDDLPAEKIPHELKPVTNAEDGHAKIKDGRRGQRRTFIIDALRPAGEHDGCGAGAFDFCQGRAKRPDFGVNPQLSYFACNELGILRPEIEYDDLLHGKILAQ